MRLLAAALLAILGLVAPAQAQQRTQYVFAISWEPAFCEGQSRKPECRSQTADRFDASHFSLHGLWPQRMDFCDVSRDLQARDRDGDWAASPTPNSQPRPAPRSTSPCPARSRSLKTTNG
ncbi:MAG TPA: hypothetical protein PK286_12910 [Devosia sp.]|nr:hypothetical protein [Devosia sp.]